eukprot:TRINITY_DN29671_c0_g1_i1.p1 TRINITY_DN29671_c0_g1~~TRINITY_DN29671_c0_g1_i1.p1  ORF type:complete len:766 (+),score=122.39 TRINITY_DN29671_c0_g1_i1:90-2387(+)
MPQIAGPLGRSWAVGTDDFALVCPGVALTHILWAALAQVQALRRGSQLIGVPRWLWDLVFTLCILAVLLDVVITFFASRGAILDTCRRSPVVTLLGYRAVLGLLVSTTAATAVTAGLVIEEATEPSLDGFVTFWNPSDRVCFWLAGLLLIFIIGWHVLVSAMAWLLSKPAASHGALASGASRGRSVFVALRAFGASDSMAREMVEVLMQLLGDVDLVPSDVVFGLMLVGLRQRQDGRGAPEPGSAIDVGGSPEDEAVLRDFQRLVPYAFGIYGCGLHAIGEAACEGTSMVQPLRLAAACGRVVLPPCLQSPKLITRRCQPASGDIEGDDCIFGSSYPLRRLVAEQDTVELLWATWQRTDVSSAPPFAVLLDHESQELVITIRGTFSVQDCLIDARCKPEYFDPFASQRAANGQEAQPETGAEAERYAHAGMLVAMRDIKNRLAERGILEDVLAEGRRGHGYKIVVTGHSLGAGVAVLLALELRSEYGEAVRYVGFEPPGCAVSPGLASEIEHELGWSSLVLSQDWVPRISVRSLQLLREQVLDEIANCEQSKFQLAMLMSRRGVVPMFCPCWRWLRLQLGHLPRFCRPDFARGRLARDRQEPGNDLEEGQHREVHEPDDTPAHVLRGGSTGQCEAATVFARQRRAQRAEAGFYALPTRCPGRRLVLRSMGTESMLCGLVARRRAWKAAFWQRPEDLDELLVATDAVEAHFPFIIEGALKDAIARLDEEGDAATRITPQGGPPSSTPRREAAPRLQAMLGAPIISV